MKKAQFAAMAAVVTMSAVARGQVCEPEIVYSSPAEEGRAGPPLVAGDLLYVSTSPPPWAGGAAGGLRIYDLSDPLAPRERSRLEPGRAARIAATGDLVIIGGYRYPKGYLQTVDVSNPDAPRLLGELELEGGVRDVCAVGSTVYATVGTSGVVEIGLVIIDITDPESPAIVSILETPGRAAGLAVEGSLAYIADGDGGLRIVDVADPTAPREVGSLTAGISMNQVAAADRLARIGGGGAVLIVDVIDPTAPAVLATLPHPAFFGVVEVGIAPPLIWFSVAESGRRGSLIAVDASDPSSPVIAGALDITGGEITLALTFSLHDSAAYVVSNTIDGIGGIPLFQLRTVDISSCADCSADCDGSGSLDFFDFLCFQNLFAAGDPQADCDGSGGLDLLDFLCFQNRFVAGCP
jgi:hypothetical protein